MSSDADVLAEIARLTSAIDQHKRYTAPPTRGRGRGRSTLIHRNATWVAPHLPQPSASRSDTTTPIEQPLPPAQPYQNHNSSGGTKKQEKERPKPVEREVEIGGVTFVADSRGNKLVRRKSAPINPVTPSTSSTSIAKSSPVPQDTEANSTPRRTSHLGTTYIRTKSGNLVSLAFARDRKQKVDALKEGSKKVAGESTRGGRGRGRGRGRGAFSRSTRTKPSKPKSDKLCIFFQKTGQCSRAQTCPYIHDSTKIAMCPLFLRSNCPRTSSTCPLSHSPNPHRSPHCSHFPHCTRASCPYAHVVVSGDAKVCREFVEYGWCLKGEECGKRHVRECWRFSETGKCEVKGCKEPHVLRRIHQEEESEQEESEQEEIELDAEDELEREEKGVKRKRESVEGISGEAGRKRSSKNKKRKAESGGLQDQTDFVELFIPSSSDREDDDDEEEEEEEEEEGGSEEDSVDSDDLVEDEEESEGQEKSLSTSNPQTSNISQPIATRPQPQATDPKVSSPMKPKPQVQTRPKPRKHYDDAKQESEPLELDYGLSSSEDEGAQEGDETVYLDADEGEEEEDEANEDADVVNLLRR